MDSTVPVDARTTATSTTGAGAGGWRAPLGGGRRAVAAACRGERRRQAAETRDQQRIYEVMRADSINVEGELPTCARSGDAVIAATASGGVQGTKVIGEPARRPDNGELEDVAGERVRIFARREAAAAADHRRPGERAPDQVHGDLGIRAGGEDAGVDAALDAARGEGDHLVHEGEAGPLLGDLRDRAIDEHQLEELALFLGELVVGPPAGAHFLERIVDCRRGRGPSRRAGGTLPRRARRRCRPCSGSSCRSRRGCTRCARRSCGWRRCGSPR